ncbi:uncharacterized protein LOC115821306 [Chanos chanos]|uniref:Uncharacterized protein LOC115821306 n=1 Tax=Chanos chanos TaxID=29144 RepID=A0A6J2W9F7_CHACN|nr:uncharacterized protein LOC115821306 [Chanos chanos]
MSDSETIELAGLGRPFQLGMLYDCRRDVLIPGITLWDSEMLQKNIDICPQPNTDFKIIASDSCEDKADALNVTASLEASFLCGLVSVKGSAEFLSNKKTSKHQSRVTLQYHATTRFEQLTMDHLGTGNLKHCNVLQEGSATHVVTALLYGAQAFFVFDREISKNENHQEIQGNLQAAIKKIPLISVEGQASLKMSEAEQKQTEMFSCTFHGDFALESNPVSFQDAISIYGQLPRLLGEKGENAVPITVWLYPLKKLDSLAAQLVREISISLVCQCRRIFDELDDVDMQCQDLMKADMAIMFPDIKAKVRKFKELCSEYKMVFQRQLCQLLPAIRGGGKEEAELIIALRSKKQSPFRNDMMISYLQDREREINVLRSYLDLMKDIPVVSSSSELDRVVLSPASEFVVSFVFSSITEDDKYLAKLENYLREEFKSKDSNPPTEFSVADREQQWFHSGEVTTQARQDVRLFLDFKESNRERENIQFCIASVPNKLITGASIHVYENGTLLSSQFQLPSKPEIPTVLSVQHESVLLKLHPPAFGISNINSYLVLYQGKGESEWTNFVTKGSSTEVKVSSLKPNKEYRFCCKAVCRPGVSPVSQETDFFKTRPCGPPGAPMKKSVTSESIAVTWDIPTSAGDDAEVIGYVLEFRECAKGEGKSEPWESVQATYRECTLLGLKTDTTYSIRVSANCGKAGKSLPSAETILSTSRSSESRPEGKEQKQARSEQFLEQTYQLEKGNPSIHVLELREKFAENVRFKQFVFGKKVEKINNKVILIMGSTGAGKTTLINMMINYILGIKWEDNYRFKLIHEITNLSQANSQTTVVTSYELYNQPGFQIPYSLTIIDTPGFGDTRGLSYDKQIIEQLKSLICDPLGIDHIDAVCFVVQAALVRLSANQKYIFDSILSIFGKDIAENILILVTFADGKNIPALEAIQAAELPCKTNKKGVPMHFKFNNSVLYASNRNAHSNNGESDDDSDDDDDDDDEEKLKKIVWTTTVKQMKSFFKALGDVNTKDLSMTKRVLEERDRLENAMSRLTPQITAGLSKLNEIKTFKKCLEQEGEIMEQNQHFETEVEVLVAKRSTVNFTATNCNKCFFTCHSGCFLPEEDNIRNCAVMDDDGFCIVCPSKCSYMEHAMEKAIYNYETKIEKKTIEELKDNFMKAQGKFMNTKQMLQQLEDDFHLIEDRLKYLITLSSNCLKRLNDIALKPTSLSTAEYIEILIKTEESEQKPGFEDRIIGLKKMKYESEILEKIARGENVLPHERRMIKEKQMRMKKIYEKVKAMQKVVMALQGSKEKNLSKD